MLLWIWELAGAKDLLRWLVSYFNFSWNALLSLCFGSWLPSFLRQIQPWLEPRYPKLWLKLLSQSYALTTGMGRPQLAIAPPLRTPAISSQDALSG